MDRRRSWRCILVAVQIAHGALALGRPGVAYSGDIDTLVFPLSRLGEWRLVSKSVVLFDPHSVLEISTVRSGQHLPWMTRYDATDRLTTSARGTVWWRIIVHNDTGHEASLYWTPSGSDTVVTYHTLAGPDEPPAMSGFGFSNRGPVNSQAGSTLLQLAPDQVDTIYTRFVDHARGVGPNVRLDHALEQQGRIAHYNFWQGLFMGLLLLLIIYNTLLYFTLRDLTFLSFDIFLIGVLLFYGTQWNVFGVVVLPHWSPRSSILITLSVPLITWGGLGVMRNYLKPQHQYPKLYHVLVLSAILSTVLMALNRLVAAPWRGPVDQAMDITLVVFICAGAAIQVLLAVKGSTAARIFLLANTPYIITLTLQTLSYLLPNGLDVIFWSLATQVAVGFQVTVFSLAVGYQIQGIRKDKERAQAEALNALRENERIILDHNRTLESKVAQRTTELSERNLELDHARKRSDELLLNILPEEVMHELKDTGAAAAKHFDNATILFTDFKGFTQASERMSPQELVEELNTCFKAFDHIITARDIEKIKTIGDAYMCAGGLPDPKTSSPADVVHAALEMQAFMTNRKKERDAQDLPAFEMRVGIHTGPVVAGIVGVKKFQYDIWGDTVNTASRMESSGEVGQVNISEATYALVKEVNSEGSLANGGSDHGTAHSPYTNSHSPAFTFTPRGKVQAKGKGQLEMYFVHHGTEGA